jgi:hypothetical protein
MSAEADVKLDNFKGLFSLDGKVAVVTGGSRGLGLHAASGYAHQDMCLSHTPSLQLIASSKPAARKSSSHPAKPPLARKHAPPSMRFPSQAKPFLSQLISPNHLKLNAWSLKWPSTPTTSTSCSQTPALLGAPHSTRPRRTLSTKSWT